MRASAGLSETLGQRLRELGPGAGCPVCAAPLDLRAAGWGEAGLQLACPRCGTVLEQHSRPSELRGRAQEGAGAAPSRAARRSLQLGAGRL